MISKLYSKLKKPLYFIVITGMLLQISAITSIFQPTMAKAATDDIASSISGGDVSNTDYVLGPPHDSNRVDLTNDADNVYASGFTGTGVITQVKIAAKGHWTGTNTNDVVTISHNKGATSSTTNFQQDTDTIFYLDITGDLTGNLNWTYLSDLQAHATYTVTGGKDNTIFHINTLWLQVTTTIDHSQVYVSTSGSDLTGDGTQEKPYATIQKAIDEASANKVINIDEGTYVEDLSIPADLTNLELKSLCDVTIKGVANVPAASWPLAAPNIEILASGVKIHGFTIEGPDYEAGKYASGMVINGQNIEIYDNNFLPSQVNDAGELGQAIITYSKTVMPSADVSGLNIHGNIFTGSGSVGMEAIYINPHTGSGTITIAGNSFSGSVNIGITVESGNAVVSNNTLTTTVDPESLPYGTYGIRFFDSSYAAIYDNITISGNNVQNFKRGIRVGNGSNGTTLITANASSNTLSNNNIGIWARQYGASVTATSNLITGNTVGIKNDGVTEVNAQNNWWGNNDPDFSALIVGDVCTDPWWTTSAGVSSVAATAPTISNITTNDATPAITWDTPTTHPDIDKYEITVDSNTPVETTTNSYTLATPLSEGAHIYKVRSHNAPNNYGWSAYSETADLIIDNASPTGSVKINSDAGVTNSLTVTLTLSASSDTEKMMISNASDFSSTTESGWKDYSTTKSWVLTSVQGKKTVYVKFKDYAGNISSVYSASIYFNDKAANIISQPITLGTNLITQDNVVITLNSNGDTTLTYAKYSTNPETQGTITAFGGYFDISVFNTSELHFPVNVKIYYTQANLDTASITDEKQILGLYYWDFDSMTWKLYSDTGVETANINVDGIDYAGYVWGNVDHFTPMTLGADTTIPNEPYGFKATIGDGEIKLTWEKVDDADHYDIRYRKATNDDAAVSYSDIYIITNTETTISGLENGVEYEFNLRAVDKADNKSGWRIVVDTPQKTTATTETEETETAAQISSASNYTATASTTEQEQITNPIFDTEIETEGAVKSEEDQADTTESTRTAVTLGIIIIAIGAALGGYYGYQWWIGKTEEEETSPKPKKKDYDGKDKEKSKQTRRW